MESLFGFFVTLFNKYIGQNLRGLHWYRFSETHLVLATLLDFLKEIQVGRKQSERVTYYCTTN